MSKYDTMTDAEIDELIRRAHQRGRQDCTEEMLRQVRQEGKEGKDAQTGKKQ